MDKSVSMMALAVLDTAELLLLPMEDRSVPLDQHLMEEVLSEALEQPPMEVDLVVSVEPLVPLDLLPMELESEALEDPWEASDPHLTVVLLVELDTLTTVELMVAWEDPLEPLDRLLLLAVMEVSGLLLMLLVLEALELLLMERPLEALDQLHTDLLTSHLTEVIKSLATTHLPTTNLVTTFILVTTTVLLPLVTMRSTILTALTATITSTHPEASKQFLTMFLINKQLLIESQIEANVLKMFTLILFILINKQISNINAN
jgi:hypothetical protein